MTNNEPYAIENKLNNIAKNNIQYRKLNIDQELKTNIAELIGSPTEQALQPVSTLVSSSAQLLL